MTQVARPLLAEDVPTGRKDYDPAIGERSQVVLNAAASKGVIDAMLDWFAGQIRFCDVIGAGAHTQHIVEAPQFDLAARKIALHAGSGGRLNHLAVT